MNSIEMPKARRNQPFAIIGFMRRYLRWRLAAFIVKCAIQTELLNGFACLGVNLGIRFLGEILEYLLGGNLSVSTNTDSVWA